MKNTILITMACLVSSVLFANEVGSAFYIKAKDNSSVVLTFDGQYYPMFNLHVLNNVLPGKHRVVLRKIYYSNSYWNTKTTVVLFNGVIDVHPNTKLIAVVGNNSRLILITMTMHRVYIVVPMGLVIR